MKPMKPMKLMKLTRTAEAMRIKERLETLEQRKKTRWRIDSREEVLGPAIFFSLVVGAVPTVTLGFLLDPWWFILGTVFSWPILFGLERGIRNLYEGAAIPKYSRKEHKLSTEDSIFTVDSWLLDEWKRTVKDLGGNRQSSWFKPENNVETFYHFVQLSRLLRDEHATPQWKEEIKQGVRSKMQQAILPLLEASMLEEEQAQIIQKAVEVSSQELYEQRVRRLLDQ